jgi:ABC-type uncharacterized transport system YnjBCD substrate-binding protein
MKKRSIPIAFLLVFVFGLLAVQGAVAQRSRLIFMTAGDVNMLALGQNVFAPGFTAENPGVQIITIHTGPGNAGSQTIFEKLLAEKKANRTVSDVDVALVHEIFMKWAMDEDLLQPYAQKTNTWKYVTSPFAKTTLGVNVEGYAMPLFQSQTAIAYNPDYVKNPPKSYAELKEWVKKNPGKFGYNGIKGGASGVAFVMGWVYAETGKYQKYAVTGPFEKSEVNSWEPVFKDLKEFNKNIVITAGNVGTLDALNRGEIWMGPVWVDMFFTFMNDGKMDPKTKLALPEPGMPGQPMFFVIPKNAPNPDLSRKFIEYVTSPKVQADEIVRRFNWYPGIDGSALKGSIPQDIYDKIYHDVTPADLQKKGLAFPLADYYSAILEAYERWAQ